MVPFEAVAAVATFFLAFAVGTVRAQADEDGEKSSIYARGDLIAINPQQSTVIFIVVIVLSTAFEYALEKLMELKNRYKRTIVLAVKEEITCIAFTHMLLLWISFSFPLSPHWRIVLQFVAVCLIYMTFAYIISISVIIVLLSKRMSQWRSFEWASLLMVSQHDKKQQLFKMCRQVFITMLPFEMQGDPDENLNDEQRQSDPNAMLIYSSIMTVVERKFMKTFTDFDPVTWIGLALVITLNGFRAVTVVSLDKSEELTRIAQSLSFIGTGYLIMLACIGLHLMLFRRLYGMLFTRAAEDGGSISKAKRTPAQREEDIRRHSRALYFGSLPYTIQVFKIILLSMCWYVALLIVGIFFVLWRDFEFYALLLYVISVIPPIVVVMLLPSTMVHTLMCACIGVEFNPDIVRKLVDGELDINDQDVEDGDGVEDEDNAGWAGIAQPGVDREAKRESAQRLRRAANRAAGATTRADEEGADLPDEWDGPTVSLHDSATEPVTGSPAKLMGVRPVLNQPKYNTRSKRPVFDDSALLRRNVEFL
jgi:hypothetical protein